MLKNRVQSLMCDQVCTQSMSLINSYQIRRFCQN